MIQVMLIDDHKIVRKILSEELEKETSIKVNFLAASGPDALSQLHKGARPNVILLDLEMPNMTGLDFLRELRKFSKIPVIVLSSLTISGSKIGLDAIEAGALDCVAKSGPSEKDFSRMMYELFLRIHAANQSRHPQSLPCQQIHPRKRDFKPRLIAIGSSTGGTHALEHILTSLPAKMPPIMVTQHLPPYFTTLFAERQNSLSKLNVIEVTKVEEIKPNHVYLAPGSWHLLLRERQGRFYTELSGMGRVNNHCPSVDVLFESIADTSLVKNTIGVILTGMGKDGAKGLLRMKQCGSLTLGQDEASCVVYGMPREAFEIGAVEQQLSLKEITENLLQYCI